jgi:hypothetical protein
MRAQLKSLLIAVIFLLAPLGAFSQDSRATLSVLGDVQQPSQWSVEELKAKFSAKIQDIKFTAGMDKSVSIGTGIPLLSLIQAAAPKAEKGTKHPDLAFLVIVEAYDSYRVFFSLAELMPQAGHAQAWLHFAWSSLQIRDMIATFSV